MARVRDGGVDTEGALVDADRWDRLRRSLLPDDSSEDVPDVLVELVDRYADTSEERLAAARAAYDIGDGEAAGRVLHQIKGSNAMLGAFCVQELAAAAEDRLIAGEPVGPWLAECLAALETAAARTSAELQRLTRR